MHTVVAVNLDLPDDLDSDRAVRRLVEPSFVSVSAVVVMGRSKLSYSRSPLSTPGGEIKLWVSALVKGRDNVLESSRASLSDHLTTTGMYFSNFSAPRSLLHSNLVWDLRANHHLHHRPANMAHPVH